MLRYFKEAFWFGVTVPGLGRLPVNPLATLGFGILGFGHPAFWLLGLGLETAFLTSLATNRRFQLWVDGRSRGTIETAARARRQELVGKLSRGARDRLGALEEKCARILEVYREAQADDYVVDGNQDALDRLTWIYLKLLVARDHLQATQAEIREDDLKRRIADLEQATSGDPSGAPTSASLRESQQATLKLLRQRLANLARCARTIQEVDSDLERVEAQIDLVLENASLHGGSDRIPGTIELASQLLVGDADFGESGEVVSALDQVYRARPPVGNAQRS
ncbi:MAG TPA: hypothetical protein VFE33_29785 [Thermoanaerobaculia bacterium]|nr:hypothetical protein [Thermoanaerobaculia bacterium]